MDWMTRNGHNVGEGVFVSYNEAAESAPAASRAVLADALDQLGFGVAVLGFGGEVLHANRAALARLAEMRDGTCGAASLAVTNSVPLRIALARAAEGKRGVVLLATPTRVMRAVLLPLGAEAGTAALVFEKPSNCEPMALGLFAREHRLTPTEQIVLSGLCEGLRVAEIARQLGAAISTVRTHVRRLLEKTSVRRQADLLGMLAALPPLAPVRICGD